MTRKIKFPTTLESWKSFFSRFMNAVMSAPASCIAEFRRILVSNNFTLGFVLTQYSQAVQVKC